MRITIKEDVFSQINPKLKVGFMLLSDINNKSSLRETKHLLKEVEKLIKLTFNKDSIKSHDFISPWEVMREGYGKKAKHYKTSVETLFKTVLKKKSTVSNNSATNIVNHLTLKYIVPITLDDADKISGKLTLALSKGDEKLTPLRKAKKGTLICFDSSKKQKMLSSEFGYFKTQKSKINTKTKNILVRIIAMPPVSSQKFQEVLNEAKEMFRTFTKAKVKTLILSKQKKSGDL
jgi:DNA/RNA-binding domain of Phe-tRNA-synthetase-like protein